MSDPLASLLTTLEMGDFQLRWEVAKVLPTYGAAALPPLLDLLQGEEAQGEEVQGEEEDWELRWFVTRILGTMAGPEVVAGLLAVVQQHPDSDLGTAAAIALGNHGAAGIGALAPLLADPHRRPLAVQVLVKIGHPAALEPLLTVVHDGDESVRQRVIEALGQFRDRRVVAPLVAALTDGSAAVRRAAAIALGNQRGQLPGESWDRHLSPLLGDAALSVAQAAAIALGKSGTAWAIASLGQVLHSPQTPEPLQITAARALGWHSSDSALAILAEAWSGATPGVQLELIAAVEQLDRSQGGQRGADILQTWLAEVLSSPGHPQQKQGIALALGRLQIQAATAALRQLQWDPDPAVQLHAAAALRMLGDEMTPMIQSQPQVPV